MGMRATSSALRTPTGGGKGCAHDCAYGRVDDSRLPWRSDGSYGGWGGHGHFGTAPGVSRTPVVFVHGNDRDACDWHDHAAHLLEHGYRGDELWAITFGEATTTHPKMVAQLDAFVERVRQHTGESTVSVVAHSLGVTGARYWMERRGRYDWVETFVGIAGANHGVSVCSGASDADSLGEYSKPCQFIGYDCAADPTHPLAKLNRGIEATGDVDYYTIRGAYDVYFWRDPTSPKLAGAEENVLLWTDHDGTRTCTRTRSLLVEWLS